jgi:hypothetical protein
MCPAVFALRLLPWASQIYLFLQERKENPKKGQKNNRKRN